MTTVAKPIRVLVVDDSALVRDLLSKMLSTDPAICVVGTAGDAYAAREKIKALAPDVLTLDVEMPRMDGLQFLRNLMRLRPMPVVMCSSMTQRGAEITVEALELGAVDFIAKPRLDVAHTLADYTRELITKVKAAAGTRVHPIQAANPVADRSLPRAPPRRTTQQIVLVGAPTGSTEAVRQLLAALPADSPPIVVAQHLPGAFCAALARRLDASSRLRVSLAEDGQPLLTGHAYLGPGDGDLAVERDGSRYRCRLSGSATSARHPSRIDLLFRSAALEAGRNALGILLTGVGEDGARGLQALREAGARTFVQDQTTSLARGMPAPVAASEGADSVLPLAAIAAAVMDWQARLDR